MRILLIEDDLACARSIEAILVPEGCSVHHAELAEDGVDLAKTSQHDLILLDLLLPDMHGLTALTELRRSGIDTPVFVLSGESRVDMRVRLLSAGADDFLAKPFSKDELMARVRAVIRRSLTHSQSLITTGKLAVNITEKAVHACGTKVPLTIKEYQLLEALSLRKGAALSKDALLNQLYGGMDEPEMKIIDVFICKLRKKLAKATGGENYIHTVWGRGYQLLDPDSATPSKAA